MLLQRLDQIQNKSTQLIIFAENNFQETKNKQISNLAFTKTNVRRFYLVMSHGGKLIRKPNLLYCLDKSARRDDHFWEYITHDTSKQYTPNHLPSAITVDLVFYSCQQKNILTTSTLEWKSYNLLFSLLLSYPKL